MNLLILTSVDFPEHFPWEDFSAMYVADVGQLEEFPAEEANRVPTYIVTAVAEEVPETLLNQVVDVIVSESPVDYVISRGIPGDMAAMLWDDDDDVAYSQLERLNTAGVTAVDPEDQWVEVVLDKEMSMENLIDTITRRVTADVLRILRAEFGDTPRRGRFRSPAPKA
jgi:hypothetical protein